MKVIETKIDFADSSFKSCDYQQKKLIVYLNSWEEKTIKIVFINAIQFIYRGGSIISNLYELTENTSFLNEALSLRYEVIPENHLFKVFGIIDIEDYCLFEIVAEDVTIDLEE